MFIKIQYSLIVNKIFLGSWGNMKVEKLSYSRSYFLHDGGLSVKRHENIYFFVKLRIHLLHPTVIFFPVNFEIVSLFHLQTNLEFQISFQLFLNILSNTLK